MDEKTYHKAALRTELNSEQYAQVAKRLQEPQNLRLLHGIIGLVTEAGELADQLKKILFYGKPADFVNLLEEIGDSDWYRNIVVDVLYQVARETENVNIEEIYGRIRQANINKLLARYPEKFDDFLALNRDTEKEHGILQGFTSEGALNDALSGEGSNPN